IGVGVGPCHYPVGPEVVTALTHRLGPLAGAAENGRVNLQACAQKALLKAGLRADRLRLLPGCTACSPNYHSHRRDGPKAGRQWAAVVLPPA
ncbi:MAG: laccase domain-containing protein, partial [Thermoanaerobaculum sp.]